MTTVIRAENLGKKYLIRHEQQGQRFRYNSLSESLANVGKAFCNRLLHPFSTRPKMNAKEEFWALKDIEFEIRQGDRVGIIGRNGAGKSTLLKILSRITKPTTGKVHIKGRVASLLEVGTGFHPELTGRENIFLNGAILGMRKAEIKRKFDEIVDFAEVEKFLDTPVKHYSSGMYVRLAFAVAAHLEPEILIVDEVLAVGDAQFQNKCLGRMEEIGKEGRTVLFVSHNMAIIQSLCNTSILLKNGIIDAIDKTNKIISKYHQFLEKINYNELRDRKDRKGDGGAKFTSIKIENADSPQESIKSSSRLKIILGYTSESPIKFAKVLVGIYDMSSSGLFLLDSEATLGLPDILTSRGEVICNTEAINLTEGKCSVNVALFSGGRMLDYIQNAAYINVQAEDFYGTGNIPSRSWVLFLLKHHWSFTADTNFQV